MSGMQIVESGEGWGGFIDEALKGSEVPASDKLARLAQLAEQQAECAATLARLEAEQERVRETFRNLSEREIPDLMDEVGVAEFKTASGLKVSIKETIRASIPKAQTFAAHAWLRTHGHSGIIKELLSVRFGKGQDEKARELYEQLRQEEFDVESNASVHPQTLSSWAKEMLAQGKDVPQELFGVFRQRSSIISTK